MPIRFVPLFPLIIAVAFLFPESGSVIYGQSELRVTQNRSLRESRNTPATNQAAEMLREMHDARKSIPWDKLPPAAQTKVRSVVAGTPLFHRMTQQKIYADPEIYNFLLCNPDFVIDFWEHLGATQLSLQVVRKDNYILKESSGTSAAVEVLYQSSEVCIVYAKGEYRGPLLAKTYHGGVVLVLRTHFTRDETNEPIIVCNLDTFVQINSLGADMLAKLFFTSLTKVAEGNFEVTMAFVGQVSRAAVRNGSALKSAVEQIPTVRNDVYNEFCDVVDRSALRFAHRNQPTALSWGSPRPDIARFDDSSRFYGSASSEVLEELRVPRRLEASLFEYAPPRLPVH